MRNLSDTAVMVVCSLALLTAMATARAQLKDPTRPPAVPEQPAAGEAAPGSGGGGGGLQGTIRRRGAKPAAVINGQVVELGGKSGDARVVGIGEDSVTLQSAEGRETLKLAPNVDKEPAGKPGQTGKKRKTAGREDAGEGVTK